MKSPQIIKKLQVATNNHTIILYKKTLNKRMREHQEIYFEISSTQVLKKIEPEKIENFYHNRK